MTDAANIPVTVALFAYNQESYVGEAIASVLAQDYSPLEIILSDDCSIDGTFLVMQQAAAAYCGPHKIVLNRNSENLNIGGHINKVNQLASGELVVAAAGDDVSAPHRVRALVDAWRESGKKAGILHSACRTITFNGKTLEEVAECPCLAALNTVEHAAREAVFVIGATEAWHKDIFRHFGNFRVDLIHEDRALPFRSLLLGKPVVYVSQPLVSYRRGVGVSAAYASHHVGSLERRMILRRFWVDMQQKLDDLKIVPNPMIEQIVQGAAKRYEVALRFEQGFPGVSEWASIVRRVGLVYFAKMVLKRIKNIYLDFRKTDFHSDK